MTHQASHRELCTTIDSYGYQSLLKFFDLFPSSKKPLEDHFFSDRDGFLARNNITFRVRKKDEQFRVDFKIPSSKDFQEFMVRETITPEIFEEMKRGIFFQSDIENMIEKLLIDRKKIQYVGFVKITRFSVPLKDFDGKWIIDHSSFPLGKDDYRLTLRHQDTFCGQSQILFEKMLEQLHLPRHEPMSKFKILMECLKEDEQIKTELRKSVR